VNTDYMDDYSVKEMAEKIRVELLHQANEKRFKYEKASKRRYEADRILKQLSDAADISAMFCFYSERVLEYIRDNSN